MKAIHEFDAPKSCKECGLANEGLYRWCKGKVVDVYNKERAPFCPLKITPHGYDDLEAAYNDACAENFKVKAERDRLQKRVEALERAIKGLGNDGGCQSCIHDDDRPFGKPCYGCNYDLIRFEFDEARFSGGEHNG